MKNQTSAWSRLQPLQKVGLIVAALAVPAGGAIAYSVLDDSGSDSTPRNASPVASTAPSAPAPAAAGKRTVTETEPVKFKSRTVKDNWLSLGEKEVRTGGVAGERTKTYEVTIVDGKEQRKLIKNEITRKPVDQVTAVGTS
ncbi:G5 domain-containing protein [Actinoplanes sp. NPDC051859]|uniref:G5 domain-containing protein n=1 Tax=Actinoplanes sp. NPDC051859 TaxID=3363909 RepID=UPI0037B84904